MCEVHLCHYREEGSGFIERRATYVKIRKDHYILESKIGSTQIYLLQRASRVSLLPAKPSAELPCGTGLGSSMLISCQVE